jgi:hypothetical protein
MVIVVAMIFSTSHTVMFIYCPELYILFLVGRHVLCALQGPSLHVTSVTLTAPVDLWVHVLAEMKGG